MEKKQVKKEIGERTKFTPIPGHCYKNIGGGTFKCLRVGGFINEYDAIMQNTASGWTFTAHGCGLYEDGTIDWDYSTKGRFEKQHSDGSHRDDLGAR